MNGPIHPDGLDNFCPLNRLWEILFSIFFVVISLFFHIYYRFAEIRPITGSIFYWTAVILTLLGLGVVLLI